MSIRGFFEKHSHHFHGQGRLAPLKPLYEAVENFMLSPLSRTKSAPHVRDPLDVKRYMSMVIIGLLPAALAGWYFFGLRVLAMIAVSYAIGGAIEVAFAVVRKEEINEGFLVTGLLFPMILPPTLPLWMVALGVAFGVLVGKELFGGTGRNLFNPALIGRCFLAIAYPTAMASYLDPVKAWPGRLFQWAGSALSDATTNPTPLSQAKRVIAGGGELTPISDLLWGSVSGSVGETSAILLIVGGVFLLLTRVGNYRTTVSMLGAFAILESILHLADPGRFVGPLWHLLAGGMLLGAFFMATDPATGPVTGGGKWVYGALIGVSAALIRNLTGYVEGVMFAILLGNIFAPVIDEVFIRRRLAALARQDVIAPERGQPPGQQGNVWFEGKANEEAAQQ